MHSFTLLYIHWRGNDHAAGYKHSASTLLKPSPFLGQKCRPKYTCNPSTKTRTLLFLRPHWKALRPTKDSRLRPERKMWGEMIKTSQYPPSPGRHKADQTRITDLRCYFLGLQVYTHVGVMHVWLTPDISALAKGGPCAPPILGGPPWRRETEVTRCPATSHLQVNLLDAAGELHTCAVSEGARNNRSRSGANRTCQYDGEHARRYLETWCISRTFHSSRDRHKVELATAGEISQLCLGERVS